jgi:membrane protein implicated in regulation of membrane protease activity
MEPVFWFVLGIVLTVLEIVAPGFVIFWFGIAGIVTGILALVVHNLAAQIVVFVVLSGSLVLASQRIARRITRRTPGNVGSERLERAEGIVTAAISPPALGMVKVLGELWRAKADAAIPEGARIRVTHVVGTHVVVEHGDTTPSSVPVQVAKGDKQ